MGEEVCACYGSDRSQLVSQDLVSRSPPGKQVLLIAMALPVLHRLRPHRRIPGDPGPSFREREPPKDWKGMESLLKMRAE